MKKKDDVTDKVLDMIENDLNNIDINRLLSISPKIRDKDLASYLDVTAGAVSQYDPKKKELMKLGLKLKNIISPFPSFTKTHSLNLTYRSLIS